ncbi:unnamed protein product [Acanthoscelides obtectus]|uniref:Uncharacterized protein n=1 Tax=Acanthoscelides obtectus TaxID=200917 RepID=A0A9P0K4A4_ACAOB|nr:unnamed protein product [Acanthoscelides obtectus]CAK1668860.1 hypothetical protein AOBTE_LOCUS26641 [Acanthoscelides obtectus]
MEIESFIPLFLGIPRYNWLRFLITFVHALIGHHFALLLHSICVFFLRYCLDPLKIPTMLGPLLNYGLARRCPVEAPFPVVGNLVEVMDSRYSGGYCKEIKCLVET